MIPMIVTREFVFRNSDNSCTLAAKYIIRIKSDECSLAWIMHRPKVCIRAEVHDRFRSGHQLVEATARPPRCSNTRSSRIERGRSAFHPLVALAPPAFPLIRIP